MPVIPGSLEELIDAIGSKAAYPDCVWRGQSNYMWSCFPSLHRRLRASGYADFQINEGLLRHVEGCMIREACEQSLLDGDDGGTVEFMALVQHYGGATRLLDVSHDPLVALYFALGDMNQTGTVFRYRISLECTVSPADGLTAWNDLLSRGEPGHPILYNPPDWDRRIAVQKGAFLTTTLPGFLSDPNIFTNETEDSKVDLVWVNPELKIKAKTYLEQNGITEQTLLPSM